MTSSLLVEEALATCSLHLMFVDINPMEGISDKRQGLGQRWEEMKSRPPSTKGDGNSAAEPKARRREKGSITCQTHVRGA